MKYLVLYLKPCNKMPRDAYAYLGFQMNNGKVKHLVATPRGLETVTSKCEECIFYKLASSSYVYGQPAIVEGKLKVIVADNRAVRRLISHHFSQVVKLVEMRHTGLIFTDRQREVLLSLANGHNLATVARQNNVSKVAVYKMFKTALRKLSLILA